MLVVGPVASPGRRLDLPDYQRRRAPPLTEQVNKTLLLSVLVGMSTIPNVTRSELPHDADAAVRLLYARHAEALHSYVVRFCPDRASAEDIVQETFIRAWRHLPQLIADDRPIRPWLLRVARNLLIDANRAARARPVTVQAQAAEDARDDRGLDQVLDRHLVTGALLHLSPEHRAVLVMKDMEGQKYETMAETLRVPIGTIRSRLHRARLELRELLERDET